MKIARHFKVAALGQSLIGAWTLDIKNIYLKYAYKAYYIILRIYFSLFIVTQTIQVCILVTERSYGELIINLPATLAYIVSTAKIYLCRSKCIQNLLDANQKLEEIILNNENEQVKGIYMRHVKKTNFTHIVYMSMCVLAAYVTAQLPRVPVDRVPRNRPQRYTALSSYVWFDKYEHAGLVWALQSVAITCGALIYITSDCIIHGLLSFSLGQIEILQHFLQNVYEYSQEIHRNENMSLEKAHEKFVTKCIEIHNTIISSVKTLNEKLSIFMLFNYFQLSFKLAFLVILITKLSDIMAEGSAIGLRLLFETSEVYLYYYTANEILFQTGEGICTAICTSKWYLCTEKVKKTLMMMMVRTLKPSKITIGPFYDMDLVAAVNLLKGCYGYIALIRNKN